MGRIALAALAALLGIADFAFAQTKPTPTAFLTSVSSANADTEEDQLPSPTALAPSPEAPTFSPSLPPPSPETPALSQGGNFPRFSSLPTGFRFWLGSETLLWWEKKGSLPASLVTTGLPSDPQPGALGQPNTLGLSGPGSLDYGTFAGLRLFAGCWLDPQQNIGLDASGFVLENRGQGFGFHSTAGGYPLLALPNLNAATGAQDAFVIAAPAIGSGGIAVQTDSQLWGADANLLHTFLRSPQFRVVGLFGFRYLDLSESLSIQTRKLALDNSSLPFLGQNFTTPSLVLTDDRFHARSQFFGGQVGLRSDYYFSHFFVSVGSKLALGRTDEVRNALGVSTLQLGGFPLHTAAGGLFALPSNGGRTLNQDFGIVPEFQLKGGVLLTRWLRATIGYDVLFWNRVLRAGNTLDPSIDPRQVPSSASFQSGFVGHSPQPTMTPSSFWAQGLTFGLEWTF